MKESLAFPVNRGDNAPRVLARSELQQPDTLPRPMIASSEPTLEKKRWSNNNNNLPCRQPPVRDRYRDARSNQRGLDMCLPSPH